MKYSLVSTTGMYGSASTWVYNVTSTMLRICDRFLTIKQLYSDNIFQDFIIHEPVYDAVVVKSHLKDRYVYSLNKKLLAPVILSINDPRKSVQSLMTRFNKTYEDSLNAVLENTQNVAELLASPLVMVFRYESCFFRKIESLKKIGKFLRIELEDSVYKKVFDFYTKENLSKIVQRFDYLEPGRTSTTSNDSGFTDTFDNVTHLHSNHFSNTSKVALDSFFSLKQLEEMAEIFFDFMCRAGYSDGDGTLGCGGVCLRSVLDDVDIKNTTQNTSKQDCLPGEIDSLTSKEGALEESLKIEQEKSRQLQAQLQALLGEHDQVKSEKLSFEESLKNEQEKSRQLQAQLQVLLSEHDQVKSEKLSFEESLRNEQEKSRQLQDQFQALLSEYDQAKSEKLSFEESLRNEQEKSRQLQLDLEDATRLRNKLEKLIMVKQQEIVLILRRVVSECTERHCRKIIGPCFNENLYLEINQDVALAISENKMASGLDHWIRFGLHENREFFCLGVENSE